MARTWNESGQWKSNAHRSSFQQDQNVPVVSSSSAFSLRNKDVYTSKNWQNFRARPKKYQASVAQGCSGLLHILGVVQSSLKSVFRDRKFASSVDKRVTS